MSTTARTHAPHPTVLRTFRALALVLAATVVIQVALAGLGVFGAAGWDWHRRFAVVVESIPLVLLVVALAGRLRGKLRWLPLVALVLVAVQHLTATVGGAAGAVHAVNAFATFGIAVRMHALAASSLAASPLGPGDDTPPTAGPRRRAGRRGARGVAATLVLALTLVACTGGGADDDAASASADDSQGPVIAVTNDEFTPETVTVAVGETVTWSFEEGAHDVVFDDAGSDVQTDGVWQRTFEQAGGFDYRCTLHPGMTGRVVVR